MNPLILYSKKRQIFFRPDPTGSQGTPGLQINIKTVRNVAVT